MSDIDLQLLAADVKYLKDRLAIDDCIHQHARGHDRFDVKIMTDCYHADGVDEDGAAAINGGAEYGAWASRIHEQSPYISAAGYIKGVRGKSDVSYMRPLTLEGEVERL